MSISPDCIPTPQKELRLRLSNPGLTPESLAKMLSGDLPALGSDRSPAEYIWEALVTDEGRADQIDRLALLCAELFGQVKAGDGKDYLLNLFLLAQMLQRPQRLFAPALELERRNEDGTIQLGPELRRELRRTIIFNQADRSQGSRWFSLIRGDVEGCTLDDRLDAFTGIVWLPPDEKGIPLEEIHRGAISLANALSSDPRGEEYLRSALRGLLYVHPDIDWGSCLATDYGNWPPLLRWVAHEEIPGL